MYRLINILMCGCKVVQFFFAKGLDINNEINTEKGGIGYVHIQLKKCCQPFSEMVEPIYSFTSGGDISWRERREKARHLGPQVQGQPGF